MRDRVTLLGGAFHLESSPGHGTKITVSIPLDQVVVEPITGGDEEPIP